MSNSLIPTEEDPHPLLKLSGVARRNFAIRTILFTTAFTVLLYLVPSYYGLEKVTTDTSYFFLNIFGFNPRLFTYEDSLSEIGAFERTMLELFDSSRATYPAISIENDEGRRANYLIVRACTGMQAGALLLGLIWSTPASFHDKVRSSYVILLALFIGNTLRIAAMIAITTLLMNNFNLDYETSWSFAHAWLGRPLGFFGTIAFTALIEKRGVRILDTITVWIDWITGAKTATPKAA